MNYRNFRKGFLALSLLGFGFSLSSCFAAPGEEPVNMVRTVSVIGTNGEGTHYSVTIGSSFDYQIEDNGMLFVGCFEEKDGAGEKYVAYDGKSVTWKDSMPDTLYAYYVSKENLCFSANPLNERNSLSNSGSGSKDVGKVSFDEAYVAYMEKSDLKALTTISFDHMDISSDIYDNWSDLIITCNDKQIYKNSLRGNQDWAAFSETFELKTKDLAKGLSISLGHASSNISGQTSTIKNVKVDVRLLTEQQLDNEITFEKLGKRFTQYVPDGSQMLRTTSSFVTGGTVIPYQVKKLLEKYDQASLDISFTISSYGKKSFVLENWGDSFCKVLDKDGNELQSKFVKLQNNSGYANNVCTISMAKGQAQLLSRANILFEYPSKNASGQPYYVRSAKLEYTFSTNV